jgi:hypothetical protein
MQQQDGAEGGRAERVLEHSRAIGRDVAGLREELSGAAQELSSRVNLGRAVHEHPFRTLLVAAGVGYVLGGGLFTPLTRRLLGAGARALVVPLVRSQLAAVAAGANG